jgi:hypothetical protein
LYIKLEKEKDSILYTSLIRNFLNTLSDPLMGSCSKGSLYNIMKHKSETENEFICFAKKEIKKLPKCRIDVLNVIFFLLKKTHDNNKQMTVFFIFF